MVLVTKVQGTLVPYASAGTDARQSAAALSEAWGSLYRIEVNCTHLCPHNGRYARRRDLPGHPIPSVATSNNPAKL